MLTVKERVEIVLDGGKVRGEKWSNIYIELESGKPTAKQHGLPPVKLKATLMLDEFYSNTCLFYECFDDDFEDDFEPLEPLEPMEIINQLNFGGSVMLVKNGECEILNSDHCVTLKDAYDVFFNSETKVYKA